MQATCKWSSKLLPMPCPARTRTLPEAGASVAPGGQGAHQGAPAQHKQQLTNTTQIQHVVSTQRSKKRHSHPRQSRLHHHHHHYKRRSGEPANRLELKATE